MSFPVPQQALQLVSQDGRMTPDGWMFLRSQTETLGRQIEEIAAQQVQINDLLTRMLAQEGLVESLGTDVDTLETEMDREQYDLVVTSFMGGTDREAFEAAIAAVPDGAEAVIRVPAKPGGTAWSIPAPYLDTGTKRITWQIDPAALITAGTTTDLARLAGPIIRGRNVVAAGWGNKNDNCGHTVIIGGNGAFENPDAQISGFGDIEEQAGAHERGRAANYWSVSDGGQRGVNGCGIASHTTITLPASEVPLSSLHKDMIVEVPGTSFPNTAGQPVRYTTRLTGWTSADGSFADTLTIAGWYRSDNAGNGLMALPTSSPVGAETFDPHVSPARILINALNKVWIANGNVFLSKTSVPTYEKTSASWFELAVFNNTGEDFVDDFNQNTHPLHFYGVDLTTNGSNGGGTAINIRGSATWGSAIRVTSAAIAFESDYVVISGTDPEILIDGDKVLGDRKTGWAAATGTADRTTFATSTVTLEQLAQRVKALIDDLHSTAGHGLIGA